MLVLNLLLFSRFKKYFVDFSPFSYHLTLLLSIAPSVMWLYKSSSWALTFLYSKDFFRSRVFWEITLQILNLFLEIYSFLPTFTCLLLWVNFWELSNLILQKFPANPVVLKLTSDIHCNLINNFLCLFNKSGVIDKGVIKLPVAWPSSSLLKWGNLNKIWGVVTLNWGIKATSRYI